jgi:hypothetical protein
MSRARADVASTTGAAGGERWRTHAHTAVVGDAGGDGCGCGRTSIESHCTKPVVRMMMSRIEVSSLNCCACASRLWPEPGEPTRVTWTRFCWVVVERRTRALISEMRSTRTTLTARISRKMLKAALPVATNS